MKTLKYLGIATLITAGLGLATAGHAADTVTFVAAGSSAQFYTFTHAFYDQGYTSHYSAGSSSSFQVKDANAPNENAQVAIYWKGSASSYQIAAFYQVDSTVGVRAYFNSDTVTSPSTGAAAPAAGNKGYPNSSTTSASDVTPPDEVVAALNGVTVNVGATDITPEDARVATQRAISLGYNATTNPIKSAVNSASLANPVTFNLSGTGARAFTLLPIGAVPVVVFINNGPAFSTIGGTANGAPPANNLNIDSFVLAGFLSGQLDRTSDLILSAGAPANAVHTYVREPLSGTYNTVEYTNPESVAKLGFTGGKPSGSTYSTGGQEFGVISTNNPLNEPKNGSVGNPAAPSGAGRIRAVGTGELVGAVAGDAVDALGYAFWGTGTFKGKAVRYLTVDGADPIQDDYTGGAVTGANVTFRNVYNGGYPLWSILRVIAPNGTISTGTDPVSLIINQVQGEDGGSDFASSKTLRVFRSYHATPYTQGGAGAVADGTNGETPAGGDVGGAVFPINADVDFNNDFGTELTGIRQ